MQTIALNFTVKTRSIERFHIKPYFHVEKVTCKYVWALELASVSPSQVPHHTLRRCVSQCQVPHHTLRRSELKTQITPTHTKSQHVCFSVCTDIATTKMRSWLLLFRICFVVTWPRWQEPVGPAGFCRDAVPSPCPALSRRQTAASLEPVCVICALIQAICHLGSSSKPSCRLHPRGGDRNDRQHAWGTESCIQNIRKTLKTWSISA